MPQSGKPSYRSDAGREILQALYEQWVAHLPGAVDRIMIETRFGRTHVLAIGPPDAPPVLVHQGGNFPNPATLHWFSPLAERYRILAPDLPGAPGYSTPRHLDGRRGEFRGWALDVLDGLELERVPHLGASFGAGIIFDMATQEPERIERMALIAPAGVLEPALWRLITQLAVPMLRYQLRPTRDGLVAAIAPLHSDPPTDLLMDTHAAVFRHLRLARRMPEPIRDHALDACACPALVIAGEDDPLFPGRALLARSRMLLPQAETELLAGSRHFPSAEDLQGIARRLQAFMPSDGPDHSGITWRRAQAPPPADIPARLASSSGSSPASGLPHRDHSRDRTARDRR